MANVIVVGSQFGDEGKAKITDLLAKNADVVVRYQGGCNAGHTVTLGDKTYKFHLIPSGILYPGTICVLSPGMVIDPKALITEIEHILSQGLDDSGLRVSAHAHVTMPYHLMLDEAEEESRGEAKIGTTKRGIGPTYADKCARSGIRLEDLLDAKVLQAKLDWLLPRKNIILERLYNLPPLNAQAILEEYAAYGRALSKYVVDTAAIIFKAVQEKKNILFEGAQGTLLDLDHGTYPYVTSSSPSAGGACVGAGVGPTMIDRVIGVAKAYSTRVGEGPFPTEQTGEIGEQLRQTGTAWAEVGTTTGRPRRCGWFDCVLGRYAVRVNGLDCLAITKLDVLDQFDQIKVCVAYKDPVTGQIYNELPSIGSAFQHLEPIYEDLPGWRQSTRKCRQAKELPNLANSYLEFLSRELDVPIAVVSVGPERGDTIVIEDPIHGPKRVLVTGPAKVSQ